jgi:hypothetical protein
MTVRRRRTDGGGSVPSGHSTGVIEKGRRRGEVLHRSVGVLL